MSSAEAASRFMARALELAERGRYTTHPNPRVGCVVVRDGAIVGEGWHQQAGQPHAEIHALRAAGDRARGAEVFVTLEPCCHHGRTGPCTGALISAGVKKIWMALQDPNPKVGGQGAAILRAAGIEVQSGLMQPAAAALNRGFISRMTRGRPWITLKLAASLDGRSAMASGESKWITSEEARADVHRLRADAGAVLTSSETVLADDPSLTVREFHPAPPDPRPPAGGEGKYLFRQPDRIVLDARMRVPLNSKVFARDGARRFWMHSGSLSPMPAGHGGEAPRLGSGQDWGEGAVIQDLKCDASGRVNLSDALARLAQYEVNHILVESGPRLAGAFLQQGLVDEIVLYLAPSLLGHEARPLALLPGLQHLEQRLRLEMTDVQRIGADLRLTASPISA